MCQTIINEKEKALQIEKNELEHSCEKKVVRFKEFSQELERVNRELIEK
jgi:hypothetical protein